MSSNFKLAFNIAVVVFLLFILVGLIGGVGMDVSWLTEWAETPLAKATLVDLWLIAWSYWLVTR